MKDKRCFIATVVVFAGVLAGSGRAAGETRFEFPTTGVNATGSALLLAIDDVLLPLRASLCYYLSRPSIRREPVIEPSRTNKAAPDHLAAHFYGSVLAEGGKFRMWYYPVAHGDRPGDLTQGPVCYSESERGALGQAEPGQVEFRGSRANNASCCRTPKSPSRGPARQRRPDPKRRYKMVYNPHDGTLTIRTATSPDGTLDSPGLRHELVRRAGEFHPARWIVIVHGQPHDYGRRRRPARPAGVRLVSSDFSRWLRRPKRALPEPTNQ
jgi:hypothetical protein